MKKVFLKLFLVMFLVSFLSSDTRSFFWKVEGGKVDSWLLGSVHVMKKDIYPLPEKMYEGFKKSSVLVVEANIAPEKSGEIAALTLKKGVYSDGTQLYDVIDKETRGLLDNRLKTIGLSGAMFKSYKPWFVAMNLVMMEFMKAGYNPSFGIDNHFIVKAGKEKKIEELEGVKFQLELFDGFSRDEQNAFLKYSLKDKSSTTEGIAKLVDMWKKGDVKGMEKYLQSTVDRYPTLKGMHEKLIDKRNETMVVKLDKMFKNSEKSHFVIVGAGHMTGEKGLVNLLKKKGYKVTRL